MAEGAGAFPPYKSGYASRIVGAWRSLSSGHVLQSQRHGYRERMMGEATFTFRVDEALKSEFAAIAKGQERSSAELIRALMRAEIDRRRESAGHDSWFRNEVELALCEADDPAIERIPNAIVEKEWSDHRADLVKRGSI